MKNKSSFKTQEALKYISNIYSGIGKLPTVLTTSYGPQDTTEKHLKSNIIPITGKRLKTSSTNPKQGKWLTSLVESVNEHSNTPKCVVELGTCIGISSMYLLTGMAKNSGGHLITFEGCPELARIAKSNISGLANILDGTNVTFEIILGPFEKTLIDTLENLNHPIDLAFIDGNHRENPTIEYHELIKIYLRDNGMIVHDDIAWNSEMISAWKKIKQMESNQYIEEVHLGWKPSRGVIKYGTISNGTVHIRNSDHILERVSRLFKYKILSSMNT